MKVYSVMKREPRTCTPQTDLAAAGRMMAAVGCGFLPVVDAARRVVGVITDRDICLALARRDERPSLVLVQDVLSGEVYSCSSEEEITEALNTMREFGVRRLPVVDLDNRVDGILSLDDVVLEARALGSERFTGPFYSDIARTLKAICSHPMPAVVA
ncbi:MAG: CBS domain-containing protein [Thermoanaerobaculia bacterium]